MSKENYDLGSLREIVKDRPQVLEQGREIFSMYIDRNTTFIQQRAFALHVFATVVCGNGCIVDA